jgi:hypothetical protein
MHTAATQYSLMTLLAMLSLAVLKPALPGPTR